MLSALLSGVAMHQVHAQNNAPIFNWQGEVQVSTSTLTIREGEALTYNIRLSEQPAAGGWWVRIHVDGVVYIDGHLEEKGIRWVPSVGWEFNRKGSSGPTQWRSVRIEALQDDGDDDEFVTITHEVWDENSNCPPSLHGVAPVEVQVTDDETASTGVALSVNPMAVSEGAGGTTVTVRAALNGAARLGSTTVKVAVGKTGDSATEGTDYETVDDLTVMIPVALTSATETFTLTPTDDVVVESDKTVTVSGTTTASGITTVNPATLTIVDDDAPPDTIELRVSPASVAENAGEADIMVTAAFPQGSATLSTPTVVNVTLAAATAQTADFTPVQPFNVTIPASAGSGTATFQFTPNDDTSMEGSETVTVSGTTTASGITTVNSATLTIIDNETPNNPPTATPSPSTGGGGGLPPPSNPMPSAPTNRAEATTIEALDFAHFANGAGSTSDFVFVNVSPHMTRPTLYFYDQEGQLMDPESVVDVTGDLMVTEYGALTVQTEMEPLGELTISTHGRGDLVAGSVRVVSGDPIGGFLRFDLPDIGVAGVGASLPLTDALFPARRQAGGIRTAAALHNLGEEAITVSCRLMSGGMVLEAVEIDLEANGQEARYIEEVFTATDTSDFVGSVRCTAPGRFTGIAVELDAGNRIFTTLPVVPVARAGGGGQETVLYFAHFANGSGTTSDLVFVNVSPRPSGPGPTPYHAAVSPSRPALYFYDREGHLMDPASVVDLTGDLEVTGDGALSIQTEMEPLGELTISTHGRGELVCGSVTVVSEGPIGGVLRYALPGIGVTGVGASQPVRDALFPARRQADGISTAAAIHNLGEEAMGVSCRLMQGGIVLEEVEIYLEANGQEARYIEEVFPRTDTSDFVGSVRCTASAEGEGMFTGIAVELDASNQIFTTLPVVPVPERMSQE